MTSATRSGPARRVGDVTCEPVWSRDELDAHFAIRRAVFVDEQHLFDVTDADAEDDRPHTLHVLGRYRGRAAGAVRLFPTGPDRRTWQGDRLSVLAPFRAKGLGGPLVRCATVNAAQRGGVTMIAHIQVPNVRFFEHLGWLRDGEVEMYVGVPHQPMRIDLTTLQPDGTGAPGGAPAAGSEHR